MKSPLEWGEWKSFDEVASTQTLATDALQNNEKVGVVFAYHQTLGRGRFNRHWDSTKGESLTMSLVFGGYPNHPAPHLIGMTVACAAASVILCELQWPNDLVFGNLKVGGILTELVLDNEGQRIPIVGVGINVNQQAFPDEIRERATSLRLYRGGSYVCEEIGRDILKRLSGMPEPSSWDDIRPIWMLFDHTPGKSYKMPNDQVATALGIGPQGELIGSINGETTSVLAADAIFGSNLAS